MPGISVTQFGKNAVAAGLFTADELKAIWSSIPVEERPKDGDAFAALLLQRARLNEFQAHELLYGAGMPLVLNQYVLLGKIGAGGMGQVFKAQHRKMKRLAAIKLLPAALAKDEATIKRFQREVEAAAKLTHPNIVQTYDADECRGLHFMVMEYVAGRDLSALLKERGPFTVHDAVDCIVQAAKGLAYAHGKGVIHRDIKPANLLLDAEGTVKILDMGLARIDAAADAADHQLTNTGQVMGTVDYMAPEQAASTHDADLRSDIYSLGCTLFRLLTGENVYHGDTVVAKLVAHMNSPIPSLISKRRDVPPEIDGIFQRMIAKSPQARFQQTGELVTELEAWRNPGATASFSSSMSAQKQDSKLRDILNSAGASSSSSSVASAPAGQENVDATLTSVGRDVPTDPKSEVLSGIRGQGTGASRKPTKRSIPIKLIAGGVAVCAALLIGIVVLMSRGKEPDVAAMPSAAPVAAGPESAALTPYEILTSPDYEWTEPENLGPGVNTGLPEKYPALSSDGLRLIYHSFAKGAAGLCEATRSSVTEPFGRGESLGPEFGNNTAGHGAAVSGDGLTLVFGSSRPGSLDGKPDLWLATRPTVTSPFAKPARLMAVNSSEWESDPSLSSDGLTLWFRSQRPRTLRGDVWTSRRSSLAADFEQPAPFELPLVPEAKTYAHVAGITLSADQQVLIFSPKYQGATNDLFLSVRPTPQAPFGTPVNLGPRINSEALDVQPCLSADGTTLIFSSDRLGGEGAFDLWMIRRVPKAKGVASAPPISKSARSPAVPAGVIPDGPGEVWRVEEACRRAWFLDGGRLLTLNNFGAQIRSVADGKTMESWKWPWPVGQFGLAMSVIALSPNERTLSVGIDWTDMPSGEKSQRMFLLDARTGQELRRVGGNPGEEFKWPYYGGSAFSPDGSQLVSTCESPPALLLWDVTTGRLIRRVEQTKPPVGLAFLPDGKRVAATAGRVNDKVGVVITDLESSAQAQVDGFKATSLHKIVLSADGKRAIAGGQYLKQDLNGKENRGPVAVFDLEKRSGRQEFVEQSTMNTYGVDMTADGRFGLTASGDGWVVLWDLDALKPISILGRHEDNAGTARSVETVRFSPDGRFAVSGHSVSNPDGSLRLHRLPREVWQVAVSPAPTPAVASVPPDAPKRG